MASPFVAASPNPARQQKKPPTSFEIGGFLLYQGRHHCLTRARSLKEKGGAGGVECGLDTILLGGGKGAAGEVQDLEGAPRREVGGEAGDLGAGEVEPLQPRAEVVGDGGDWVAGEDEMTEGGGFRGGGGEAVVGEVEALDGAGEGGERGEAVVVEAEPAEAGAREVGQRGDQVAVEVEVLQVGPVGGLLGEGGEAVVGEPEARDALGDEAFGEGDEGVRLAGYSVAQVAAVYLAEVEVVLVGTLSQEAGQQLVGVGMAQVDVATGVSALQTFHLHAAAEVALRHVDFPVGELGHGIHASRATDEQLAFVLRVEVEQDVTAKKAFLQGEGTGEARFLVYGEKALYRAVFQRVIGQDGQLGSYADAVVRTQRSASGAQPLAINVGLNGVVHKVVRHIVVLLAHHVYVRLQHHRLAAFHAWSGGFADEHITRIIYFCLQSMLQPEVLQESHYLLFMLRGAGHLAYFLKIPENSGGFQIFLFHSILDLDVLLNMVK